MVTVTNSDLLPLRNTRYLTRFQANRNDSTISLRPGRCRFGVRAVSTIDNLGTSSFVHDNNSKQVVLLVISAIEMRIPSIEAVDPNNEKLLHGLGLHQC